MMPPQHLGDLGHAHRRTRVAGLCLLHGIHRERADRTREWIEHGRLDVATLMHGDRYPAFSKSRIIADKHPRPLGAGRS